MRTASRSYWPRAEDVQVCRRLAPAPGFSQLLHGAQLGVQPITAASPRSGLRWAPAGPWRSWPEPGGHSERGQSGRTWAEQRRVAAAAAVSRIEQIANDQSRVSWPTSPKAAKPPTTCTTPNGEVLIGSGSGKTVLYVAGQEPHYDTPAKKEGSKSVRIPLAGNPALD